jgi:PAS domain S-box-containing protein
LDAEFGAERQLRLLIDRAPDYAIYMLDPGGRVASWNSGAQRIAGYEANEILGEHFSRFYSAPLKSSGEPDRALRIAQSEGKYDAERWMVRKDGSTFWASVAIEPICDRRGELLGFATVVRDITRRQINQEALRQAKERAETASKAKTEFLAVMSHEIRTPLTTINGFANLLARTGRLTKPQKRYVDLIKAASSTLGTIVDDILDFSKVEAGRVELESVTFSLLELVDYVAAAARAVAEPKGLAINTEIAPGTPQWLVGDLKRLRQVLSNLTNNAVKFTAAGHVRLSVGRQLSSDGHDVIRFAVTDTGIGVPAALQARLFERFSQAEPAISRVHGGTGLGLAICKQLVGLMGGTVGFVSEQGRGSTFWFTIPHLPGHAALKTQRRPAELSAAASGARILLVEDHELNQEIAKAMLERRGHLVDVVGSGLEAIAAARTTNYDLILMDVQMPGMDGISATRTIRALGGPLKHVPIVALSANVLSEQVESFKRAGMNGHIGKPFEEETLLGAIDHWLAKAGRVEPVSAHASAC